MFASHVRAVVASASLAGLIAAAACSRTQAAAKTPRPPLAEFLISSPDSTFWINTTDGATHLRGVPLVLAHYDRRYFEVYAAEQDQSYYDALLVGERLYRRDLITGDSTVLFADTAVAHVAAIYARTHPDEHRLGAGEEGVANPQTSATAQLDILDVVGPYLSFEYPVDIRLPGREDWHATRRGVVDLRSGKETEPGDLFGAERGREIAAVARRQYEVTRDSAVRARDSLSVDERQALEKLERRQFDSRCFALETVDGKLAITFGIPGAGEGAAGNIVELEPITVDSVKWWGDASAGFAQQDSLDNDRWKGATYSVLARYDTAGHVAHLFLTDSSAHEWPVGSALGPMRRLDWLDQPPPSDRERKALLRAFDQAARYDGNARVAVREQSRGTLKLVALGRPKTIVRHARGGQSSMKGSPAAPRSRGARQNRH